MKISTKYTSENSKYCYNDSTVLINKLDITDAQLLKEAEELLTSQRLTELYKTPIEGSFDLNHLMSIHKYIFQDIYDFAGVLRDENISKGNFTFASCQYINDNFCKLYAELIHANFLKDCEIVEFTKKCSYFMAEFNVLHPFREGNGRTIREYFRCLALQTPYRLDWGKVSPNEILQSFIISVYDTKQLENCILKIIS